MAGVDLSDLRRSVAASERLAKDTLTQLVRKDWMPRVAALALPDVDAAWLRIGPADAEPGPWWPASREDLAAVIAGKILRRISASIRDPVRLPPIYAAIEQIPEQIAKYVAEAREHYLRIGPWVDLALHEHLTQRALRQLLASRLSFDRGDARDCVATAFAEELVKQHRFDTAVARAGPAAIAHWLGAGVGFVCLRHIKVTHQRHNTHLPIAVSNQMPEARTIDAGMLPHGGPGAEANFVALDEAAVRRRRLAVLARLLTHLREPYRTTLAVEARSGLQESARAKGQVLGVTQSAYNTRIKRARDDLRDALWAVSIAHARYHEVFLRSKLGGETAAELAVLLDAIANGRSLRQAATADFPRMDGIPPGAAFVCGLVGCLNQAVRLVRQVRGYSSFGAGSTLSIAGLLGAIDPAAIGALPDGFGLLDLVARKKLIIACGAFSARYRQFYWDHTADRTAASSMLAMLDERGADGWTLLRAAADDFPALTNMARDMDAAQQICRVLDAKVRDVLAPDFP